MLTSGRPLRLSCSWLKTIFKFLRNKLFGDEVTEWTIFLELSPIWRRPSLSGFASSFCSEWVTNVQRWVGAVLGWMAGAGCKGMSLPHTFPPATAAGLPVWYVGMSWLHLKHLSFKNKRTSTHCKDGETEAQESMSQRLAQGFLVKWKNLAKKPHGPVFNLMPLPSFYSFCSSNPGPGVLATCDGNADHLVWDAGPHPHHHCGDSWLVPAWG